MRLKSCLQRSRLLSAFAAVAVSVSHAAFAAPDWGRHMAADIARATQAIADCLVRTDGVRIKKAILADPSTDAFEKWTTKAKIACNYEAAKKAAWFAMPDHEVLRSAVAEALFRKEYEGTTLSGLEGVPPLIHARGDYVSRWELPLSAKRRGELQQQKLAAIYLSTLGECVVRANPTAAHDLLASERESEAEGSAYSALHPALPGCVDQSETVKLDRESLRGAIALNYIRLAAAGQALRAQQEAAE